MTARAAVVVSDALLFSGAGAAVVATTLALAASACMGIGVPAAGLALAGAGTLVVYNIDRLRDRARDRASFPVRTAFVSSHRRALSVLVAAAAAIALPAALWSGPGVTALCGVVLGVGLLHRRLKRNAWLKAMYLTGAWTAVVVGIPVLLTPGAAHRGWVVAVLACAVAANVLATGARGSPGPVGMPAPRSLREVALASVGLAIALLAPPQVRPLAAVAGAELAALLAFRPTERYGLAVLDGALALGGAAAWLLARTT